jgi:hypothetical protein
MISGKVPSPLSAQPILPGFHQIAQSEAAPLS